MTIPTVSSGRYIEYANVSGGAASGVSGPGGSGGTVVVGTTTLTDWIATTLYAVGDLVAYAGVAFRSIRATNVGHFPADGPSKWWKIAAQGELAEDGIMANTTTRFRSVYNPKLDAMEVHFVPDPWRLL